MSNEHRSAQGSIIPTMFVGVGGTGSRIVDRIAARARRLPNWESQLEPLTTFVTIDTNELDQHRLKNVPDGNRINIAAFDKSKVIEGFRRSKNTQALQWLDAGYQPRPGYKPGAGQIRVESRLGFFYYSPMIRERLQQIVQETLRPNITWRQPRPPKYNVYFFCTLAGGTGSGSFLPAAYLVSSVIEQAHWQPRVIGNLLLSTLVLDKVGPELHADIHANAYAALKELEHLTKLDYKQVKDEGRTAEELYYVYEEAASDRLFVRTRPFFLSFVFDRPAHVSLSDAEAAVADTSFLEVFTPIMDSLAGELDNYEKKLEKLTSFPGDLKDVGLGYTKNAGACGAAALLLPGSELLEYAALRFAAQALRTQITFGAAGEDVDDDRARALARLAVDYSDPQFLAMSDDARERRIHHAFVESVQEMARQDERRGIDGGYWQTLVSSVDTGLVTGVDDKGEVRRSEALVAAVQRKLAEARRDLLNKVAIKDRAFVFHREGVNQYIELLSRLLEDVRLARALVDDGVKGLRAAANDGEVVTALGLDPITERYLVLRLLHRVESELLPEAEAQMKKASDADVSRQKVREQLEREEYETLQRAAASKKLFGGDEAFLAARDQAQDKIRATAAAARRMFDAEAQLAQLRALNEYLKKRARQYARLSTKMDGLVHTLEKEAERRRRGELADEPRLALRVEVLETLDEPRARLWDRAYHELYVAGARYLHTFDRNVLAATIARELRPTKERDGRFVEKSIEQTVADLRQSLLELGRTRLRSAIFGGDAEPGLDLWRGLALEAKLVLSPRLPVGEEPSREAVSGYIETKLRALAQIGGVLARVSSAESRAFDDGVVANRTRLLIVGPSESRSGAEDPLRKELTRVLAEGGRQVKVEEWYDPRIAIVHDVELAIPFYYFRPVVAELEDAYIAAAADERRSYHLHIDYNWEKSLPNLNPRKSEIVVGWSLQILAEGLLAGVIGSKDGVWTCDLDVSDRVRVLGNTASSALFRLGEYRRQGDVGDALDQAVQRALARRSPAEIEARRAELQDRIQRILLEMGLNETAGQMSVREAIDRPVLRALRRELDQAGTKRGGGSSPGPSPYSLGF